MLSRNVTKATVKLIQVVGQAQVVDGVGGFRLIISDQSYLFQSVPH